MLQFTGRVKHALHAHESNVLTNEDRSLEMLSQHVFGEKPLLGGEEFTINVQQ